jgi:predicted dehydrogenase
VLPVTGVVRVIHGGVGGRGRWPLEVLGADPRFRPEALVDVVPDQLAAARAATGLPASACFGSVEDALAAKEAPALVVCTPTRTPAAVCRAGFRAGKHVLVEKGRRIISYGRAGPGAQRRPDRLGHVPA